MRTLSFMKCTRRTAHLSGSNLKWPDFRSHITANTRHVSFVYAYLLHWATLDSLQHSPRTQRAKSSSCRPSKTMTFLNECWRDAPNLFLFSFFFTFTLQKSVPILHGWFWQQIYNKYTYQNKKMWKKRSTIITNAAICEWQHQTELATAGGRRGLQPSPLPSFWCASAQLYALGLGFCRRGFEKKPLLLAYDEEAVFSVDR